MYYNLVILKYVKTTNSKPLCVPQITKIFAK